VTWSGVVGDQSTSRAWGTEAQERRWVDSSSTRDSWGESTQASPGGVERAHWPAGTEQQTPS